MFLMIQTNGHPAKDQNKSIEKNKFIDKNTIYLQTKKQNRNFQNLFNSL